MLGNTLYGLSVLLKNPEVGQSEGSYLLHHLPWLVGSLGVLLLDTIVSFRGGAEGGAEGVVGRGVLLLDPIISFRGGAGRAAAGHRPILQGLGSVGPAWQPPPAHGSAPTHPSTPGGTRPGGEQEPNGPRLGSLQLSEGAVGTHGVIRVWRRGLSWFRRSAKATTVPFKLPRRGA